MLTSCFSFDSSREKLEFLRCHWLSSPLPGITVLSHTSVYTANDIVTEKENFRDQTQIQLENELHRQSAEKLPCCSGESERKNSG